MSFNLPVILIIEKVLEGRTYLGLEVEITVLNPSFITLRVPVYDSATDPKRIYKYIYIYIYYIVYY